MPKETPSPKLARWQTKDLKLSDYNPRRISKARFEDLKRSMAADATFLEVRPIIVNVNPTRRGIVIGGHMRALAAIDLKMADVPVVEVFADAKTEKRWNVMDNSHHGEFDKQRLAELVLPDPLAFEHALPTDQLDNLLDEFGEGEEGKSEEDAVDEVAAAKTHLTKTGDVWELGDHKLICGDSTDAKVFDKLLGQEKAQMTFTDPPYNVDYGASMKDKVRGKEMKIANDKMDAKSWGAFLKAFLTNIHARTAGATYICMSTKEWPSLHQAFVNAGFHWSDTILWVKDSFTMGRADHQRQYEPIMVGKPRKMKTAEAQPILYGWPEKCDRKWNGGRDEADAWYFTRPRKNPIHPTQKPVELVARAVSNSSNRGDTVLDCFAGGGSTLIACERTARRARLIELDAGYCDAIVARYVGHTKNAKLKLNGKAHEWKGPVITIEGVLDSLG